MQTPRYGSKEEVGGASPQVVLRLAELGTNLREGTAVSAVRRHRSRETRRRARHYPTAERPEHSLTPTPAPPHVVVTQESRDGRLAPLFALWGWNDGEASA